MNFEKRKWLSVYNLIQKARKFFEHKSVIKGVEENNWYPLNHLQKIGI